MDRPCAWRSATSWWFALTLALGSALAGQPKQSSPDLTAMSLEELANIEVTSVGKKTQKLSQTAAAVYVITQEDIRRSGATSIPEALRMAPGLEVARIDASKWAISSRGFNGQYSNKMLVLIDGRSVYSPLFSGVYWDAQDLLLEDVDRIEIIRGPGATMWGANAVNGVINVISKRSQDTQGALMTAGAGNEERGFGGIRYGARLGSKTYYRVYWKHFDRGSFRGPPGLAAAEDWQALRGGFRVDGEPSAKDSWTIQGDVYDGRAGQTLATFALRPPYSQAQNDRVDSIAGHVLARWRRRQSGTSETTLQLYYDHWERSDATLGESRHTVDVDFQHRFSPAPRHEILWGLANRFTTDHITSSRVAILQPGSRGSDLYSAFVQDEVTLLPDRFRLAFGSKFEHNDYTGFEVQPSVRLLWEPHRRHSAWVAISRAVRTPSRGEQDSRVNYIAFAGPGGSPLLVAVFGQRRLGAETLDAYELGYRIQPAERFSLDIATFYNVYRNLLASNPGAPFLELDPPPPHLLVPVSLTNGGAGRAAGVEIAARFSATERWKWSANYTALPAQYPTPRPDSALTGRPLSNGSPRHQFHLRSYWDLTSALQWDSALYYVDSLPAFQVPGYARLDTRIGWRPLPNLDLSLVLQNVLGNRHAEFLSEIFTSKAEVGRSAYARITWRP